MPSTYTLNNGIELIGTGEQSGTWGDTTNLNLELLDTALDGQVTVSLASAGTSGSPNTLAISDGAASDGRNRMVIFDDSSDLGATAYVQLTPNDAEKIIYVRNDLSGSRSIILFQGTYNASNDYEVPAGTTAVVYFDGAGAGAVAANVFNNAYFDSLRLGGVSVTAIIDDDSMGTASATNIATSESIKAYVDAQVGANNELSEILANGNTTGGTDISVSSGDDITFADSSKAIFGAGSDLQIYHDPSGPSSLISDQGDGDLILRGSNQIRFQDATGAEHYAIFNENGAVQLYYDNALKLATTSTGVNVTGRIEGDTLNIGDQAATYLIQAYDNSGSTPISFGFGEQPNTARGMRIEKVDEADADPYATNFYFSDHPTSSNGSINFFSSQAKNKTLRIDSNGDITFYDASGNASFVYDESAGSVFNEQGDNKDFRVESDSRSNMFFVDASTNRIGINTNAPTTDVDIVGQGTTFADIKLRDAAGRVLEIKSPSDLSEATIATTTNHNLELHAGAGGATNYLTFKTDTVERLEISSGAVIFNDTGADTDFRVESDSNTHALFVDAGNNRVKVGSSDTSGFAVLSVYDNRDNSASNWFDDRTGLELYNFSQPAGYGTSVGILLEAHSGESAYMYSEAPSNSNVTGYIGARTSSTNNRDLIFWTPSSVTINDDSYDADFRVESDSSTHALFVDAGNNHVSFFGTSNAAMDGVQGVQIGDTSSTSAGLGMATANHSFLLYIDNSNDLLSLYDSTNNVDRMQLLNDGTFVFNQTGVSSADFRVESDTKTHALFVDAGANRVSIGSSSFNYGTGLTIHDNEDAGTPTALFLRNSGTSGGSGSRIHAGYVNTYGAAIRFSGNPSSYRMYGTYFERITGDGPTYATSGEFGTTGVFKTYEGVVHNESGNDRDFRVESDSNANMLLVDAGLNTVQVGTTLTFGGSLNVSSGGIGVGESGSAGFYRRMYWNEANNDLRFWNGINEGIINSSGAFVDASDVRLKKDIADIEYGIDTVKSLKPRKYKLKSSDVEQVGFVAQEMELHVPEIVTTGINPDNVEQKGIAYGQLTAVLTKAMQEQQTIIETLEARITALENA
jgi:hypothetical protein